MGTSVQCISPPYGVEGMGRFLGMHCFTDCVKVAFFRSASLRAVPPSKPEHKQERCLDIHEDDPLARSRVLIKPTDPSGVEVPNVSNPTASSPPRPLAGLHL